MLYDTIIIGGGPAGISAAVYAARKGLKFAIVAENIGGQVLKTSYVENYTGYQEITGPELVHKFEEHFAEFNFDFHQSRVENVSENQDKSMFEVKTAAEKLQTKTLLVATGAKPRHMNIPGEKELRSRGLSYCTTCDGPLFRNKDVAIIGGGNSALESALHMSNIARKIYVVNLTESFTGDEILIRKIEQDSKIEVLYNTKTLEILGKNLVSGVKVEQAGVEKIIVLQGVFVNIGFVPQVDLVEGLVDLDNYHQIKIDLGGATSHPRIFAAGDCTNAPYKQIITAAGAGANAALGVFGVVSRLEH